MKVNEIFIVEREVRASTGADYYVGRIKGKLAILDVFILSWGFTLYWKKNGFLLDAFFHLSGNKWKD